MRFDRELYFNSVRSALFKGALSQQQVDGQSAILSQWETQSMGTPMDDMRWLAYMLATTYHETAQKMWPIEEYGKGQGMKYGAKDPETGQTYYGRGFVQLTWRDNYHKATVALGLVDERDIEWHAEQALDLIIASRIMFRGMAEGWFTGKKLGMYFNDEKDDPVNARIIINNDVSKMGQKIAAYHDKFYEALDLAALPDAVIVPTGVVVVNMIVPKGITVELNVTEGT